MERDVDRGEARKRLGSGRNESEGSEARRKPRDCVGEAMDRYWRLVGRSKEEVEGISSMGSERLVAGQSEKTRQ